MNALGEGDDLHSQSLQQLHPEIMDKVHLDDSTVHQLCERIIRSRTGAPPDEQIRMGQQTEELLT